MAYSDNVRKVYGKVTIVYSDSEISREIQVLTSGNAVISAPEQVTMGRLTPEVKACTMEGIATMGGGYQMLSAGLIMGWWSEAQGNIDGNFGVPYPYLELSFNSRPITKWTILGDDKLAQYPVDFNLICYNALGVTLDIKEIRGNDCVGRTVQYSPAVDNVARLRIEVLKWNKPNTRIKLLQFFDILEETYEGSELKDFEVLEQLGSGEGLNYGVNSDTAGITILNTGRKFDKGYLKSLVLLDRKVKPYIGIADSTGAVAWTSLGTFYSDEWHIPSSPWIKVRCVDKLLRLQNITYVGYPYTENATLYDLAEDILLKAGFQQSQYQIDTVLQNQLIYKAFLPKGSVWDSLCAIAGGALANIYMDRDDVLRITVEKIPEDSGITIGANRIFTWDSKTTLTDFSNYIEVEYSDIIKTTVQSTVFENVITLDAQGKATMLVDYTGDIADALLDYLPGAGIELSYFYSGINAGKFELRNTTDAPIATQVSIKGFAVRVNKQTVVVRDEESINRYGIYQFGYAGGNLIQSYDQAFEIGQSILNKLKAGNGEVRLNWRGDPSLKLEQQFVAGDRYGDSADYICHYNRFAFDGGLKQETKGKKMI